MSEVVETIKKIAQHEVRKLHVAELGVITSIFPHEDEGDKYNYECNLSLKNLDIELRRVPVATQGIGLVNVPNVGDLVLVSFVNGDINAPIIVGRLYTDKDRPPKNKNGELIFKPSYEKNTDLRRFHLEFPSVTFTIKDDSIVAVAGSTKVTIKTDGDVTIESNGKVEVKAQGDLSLTGANIKIESQQALQIKAGSTADIKSSATMNIKGSVVNIN